jgi:hypothetical protein
MPHSNDSAYWAAEKYRDRLVGDLRNGAIAGILGGASIMVLVFLFDALLFKPLTTPNFPAQVFMDQAGVTPDGAARLKLAQTGVFIVVHLALFAILGIVLVKFLRIFRFRKTLLLGGIYGLAACTSIFGVSSQLLGADILYRPKWLVVPLVNFIAGIVMAVYLQAVNPQGEKDQS